MEPFQTITWTEYRDCVLNSNIQLNPNPVSACGPWILFTKQQEQQAQPHGFHQ